MDTVRSVKMINASSTQTIISISNENFKKISESLYKFLSNIVYDDVANSLSVSNITSSVVSVNTAIEMLLNGTEMFKVTNNGFLNARNMLRTDGIVQAGMARLVRNDGFPARGKGGEIVYGRNDFWGYIQDVGWLSLTRVTDYDPNEPTNIDAPPISWCGSVLSIIKKLPDLPTRYCRYLVDWTDPAEGDVNDDRDMGEALYDYKGYIAEYSTVNQAWSYFQPDDGSFVVNEEEGNVVYVASVGASTSWSKASFDMPIGNDEDSDDVPYTGGRYDDFTKSTTVGTAIDRFNQDLFKIYDASILPFKHIMGVVHTSPDKSFNDETLSTSFNLAAKSIFVDDVPSTPSIAVAGETPVAVYVTANLVPILESVSGDDVTYHAFQAKWPSPLPVGTPSGINVGDNITNVISPAFGVGYRVKIYANGVEIPTAETPPAVDRGWVFQYNTGIVYQLKTTMSVPTHVELYYYSGEILSRALSNSFKLSTSDKWKLLGRTLTGDNANTRLFISDTPRKNSSIMVFVNGSYLAVGNGVKTSQCYFSGDSGITARYMKDVSLGDILFVNCNISGISLSPTDRFSFEYLTPTDDVLDSVDNNLLAFGNFTVSSYERIYRYDIAAVNAVSDPLYDTFIVPESGTGRWLSVNYINSYNETSLGLVTGMLNGDVCVLSSNDHLYVYDTSITTWVDNGEVDILDSDGISAIPVTVDGQYAALATSIVSGSFVNIFNDGSGVKLRTADARLGRVAHGYILTPAFAENVVRVYYSGINSNVKNLGVNNGSDNFVFLSWSNNNYGTESVNAGVISKTPPIYTGYYIQNLGYMVGDSSMYVEIQDSIYIERGDYTEPEMVN